MSIKPILFNTEMVRAILDGRKTVTRRVIKFLDGQTGRLPDCGARDYIYYPGGIKYPPYQPGDILYVRETWSEWTGGYLYKAWNSPFPQPGQSSQMKWHPSIHMPKEASRIWLKVTDVRVERLKEVTEEQAAKEGAIDNRGFIHSPDNEYDEIHTAREHFEKIWDSTIQKQDLGIYGWDANPWVWVIEFERCEKPEEVEDE